MKYYPTVIREAHYFVGMDAPHEIFMAKIEQESRCDEGITAFDNGRGLGQFMDETAEWLEEREPALREISIEPHPYDPRWSIRAVILYDKYLYDHTLCTDWYYAERAYNGGLTLLNKEITRAGTCNRKAVEAQCKRRILALKNGKKLDLCRDVNIPYYYLIEAKAEKYKRD
jgi:hypothetical protein